MYGDPSCSLRKSQEEEAHEEMHKEGKEKREDSMSVYARQQYEGRWEIHCKKFRVLPFIHGNVTVIGNI